MYGSPPTEASIKSFIYHSVPDILDVDSSGTDSLSCNGGLMTPSATPTPTSCPQKMPLLRAISMYQPLHRIWKKSDASHKYVTR